MKLAQWLNESDWTLEMVARHLAVSKAMVFRYAAGTAIPRKNTMQALYRLTGGSVAPNDFYVLSLKRRRPPPRAQTVAREPRPQPRIPEALHAIHRR